MAHPAVPYSFHVYNCSNYTLNHPYIYGLGGRLSARLRITTSHCFNRLFKYRGAGSPVTMRDKRMRGGADGVYLRDLVWSGRSPIPTLSIHKESNWQGFVPSFPVFPNHRSYPRIESNIIRMKTSIWLKIKYFGNKNSPFDEKSRKMSSTNNQAMCL